MKRKLLASNLYIASLAAFGGLILISFCAFLLQQYGVRLSIVALGISLWGFLSIIQRVFSHPKKQQLRKIGYTTALIVFIGGGSVLATIKVIDDAKTQTPNCTGGIRKKCPKIKQTPCPKIKQITPCPLDITE